jgi:hypothetical protein
VYPPAALRGMVPYKEELMLWAAERLVAAGWAAYSEALILWVVAGGWAA